MDQIVVMVFAMGSATSLLGGILNIRSGEKLENIIWPFVASANFLGLVLERVVD